MSGTDPAELARKRLRHRNERIVAAFLILVAAAAAAVTVRWNRRESAALRGDQRYIPRPLKMTPEVTMLQELVRIDSSKPQGVALGARWIAATLERNGIEAEIIESAPSMLNVYARIKGRSPGEGLLLFNHIDVVPPGEGWTVPPFEARMFGDRMVGRGTVDMKALTVCQLASFVDLAKSGRVPAHDLVFLATADEETGSQWGMQWLLAHRPDIFAGVAYGITEGGLTEIMNERMTYFGVEIGGKQVVQLQLEAPTREDLREARIALEPYIFSHHPDRVLPEVRRFFAYLAPTRTAFRPYLADIDATVRNGQFWRLPAAYRDLLQNSITTGGVEKTANGWEMQVTMRNLPDEQPEARIAWLAKTVAPTGARVSQVLVKEGPNVFSSEKTRLFEILIEEARARHGVPAGTQILYRSASDCRFLRPAGITCYGLSPYRVDYYQSLAIHHANESITVGAFQEGVDYMRTVIRTWAGTS
jgi:acetylornithine deacetylase/succinyl-diaminopimelate desuccinylase-like protein